MLFRFWPVWFLLSRTCICVLNSFTWSSDFCWRTPSSFIHSELKAGAPAGASQHVAAQLIITLSQKLEVNFSTTMRFDLKTRPKLRQGSARKFRQLQNSVRSKLGGPSVSRLYRSMLSTKAKCLQKSAMTPRNSGINLEPDQIHIDQLPYMRRVLSSIHASNQLANFILTVFLTIFRW